MVKRAATPKRTTHKGKGVEDASGAHIVQKSDPMIAPDFGEMGHLTPPENDTHSHRQKSTPTQNKPHFHGHRARLRSRLKQGGLNALQEYEVLELILFRVFPRKDVKPLAKRILERFGTLTKALHASEKELTSLDGVGQAVADEFMILRAVMECTLRQNMEDATILSSAAAVENYCRHMLSHKAVEEFHILFLDKHNVLIKDEKMSEGTLDHAAVYPREVIKRALELNATAMILIHNHPSGDPNPSHADIMITEEIIKIATPLDITVHDHIIITKTAITSLKALRLI